MDNPPKKFTRLKILLTCFSVVLLVVLVMSVKNPWELLEVARRAMEHPLWLVLAVAAFGGSLTCGTLRWGILLKALKVPMGWSRAVQLYAVGHFYNILIPGATGGDIVKAGCAVVDHPERKPEAIASILAERLIGFVALAVVVVGVAVFRGEIFSGIEWVRWYCFGFGAAMVLGFGVLLGGRRFLVGKEKSVGSKQLAVSGETPSTAYRLPLTAYRLQKILPIFLRLYDAIHFSMRHPATFGKAFALSLLNHVFTGLCTGLLTLSLGMKGIDLIDVVCVMAVVSSVTAILMTPGGAGVREVALTALLVHINFPKAEAVTVSLLMFGVILLWAAFGGICYAVLRVRQKRNESRRF